MKLGITTKIVIRTEQKKLDGTNIVYLRVTKDRKVRYMSTGLVATSADLSKDRKKIKNYKIIDQAEAIHRRARQLLIDHCAEFLAMDAAAIVQRLAYYIAIGETFRLDFFDYANRDIDNLPRSYTTRKGYETALGAFERYMDGKRDVGDITNAAISGFASSLVAEGMRPGSVNAYVEKVLAVYRRAQREYNDDFHMPIPRQLRFELLHQVRESGTTRAISCEEVQKIIDVKLDSGSVLDFARDMFIISFFLCGINFKDICMAKAPQNGVLKYRRSKIAAKAGASADMEIIIPDAIKPILDKYKDPKGVYFTNITNKTDKEIFYRRSLMGSRISMLAQMLGFKFTFYSARHTFATIARNDLKIEKATLDECLTHIGSHRMTDIYIKRDYSAVNEVCSAISQLFDLSRYNGGIE